MAYKATITKFGLQSGTTDTLYASWDWPPSTTTTKGSVKKYPSISYTGTSVIEGLRRAGETDTSLAHRKKIAVLNGYVSKESAWKGTATQNTKMLNDLKAGKLIKSKSGSSSSSITGTDHYKIQWQHKLNGIWYTDSDSDVNVKNSTCKMSSNTYVTSYRFRIKPVAKEKETTKNGKTVTTYPWTAEWTEWKYYTPTYRKPAKPSAPTLELSDGKITATLTGITDTNTTHVRFKLWKYQTNKLIETSADVKVLTGSASFTFKATLDGSTNYVVNACGLRVTSTGTTAGDYSAYSSATLTSPAEQNAPEVSILSIADDGKSATAQVKWDADATVTKYEVQWTYDKNFFSSTSGTIYNYIVTDPDVTSANVTIDLTKGNTWYFRVCTTNSKGTTSPDNITEINTGLKPSAPTTWSNVVSLNSDDTARLEWTHNSVDGSEQSAYELVLKFADEYFDTITGTTDTYVEFVPADYLEHITSPEVLWKVRTKGAYTGADGWSDYSVERQLNVYENPTLSLDITDGEGSSVVETEILSSYPLTLDLTASPSSQSAVGFYVELISKENYSRVDVDGSVNEIVEGQVVYSKYYAASENAIEITISAGDVILENGADYNIKVTVAMDSGLTAENECEFQTAFTNANAYIPNAEIVLNDDISATIHPYCYDLDADTTVVRYYEFTETSSSIAYRNENGYSATISQDANNEILNVTTTSDKLKLTATINDVSTLKECINVTINCDYENDEESGEVTTYGNATVIISDGSTLKSYEMGLYNESAAIVDLSDIVAPATLVVSLEGFTEGGTETTSYYSIKFDTGVGTTEQYAEGVVLDVYRREYDGTLTKVAGGIDSANPTYVTDMHPALDYARYRIVATDTDSGTMGYTDVPAIEVGIKDIVIQWDEETNEFMSDTIGGTYDEEQIRSGSVLRLPYNVDISENNELDVSLVNYIGRRHPVAYYGTQVGQKATWSCAIPKDDTETLYQIRRLAIWTGNAYVREPSGSGYLANVKVNFSKSYDSLTIPVSFTITRVEGE